MENKRKHLEFIQNNISRMASNTSQLKGLCVTISAAICALSIVRSNAVMYLLLVVLIVSFWIMDAHYLRQEKLFRALYDSVRVLEDSQIDFSMDTSPFKAEVTSLVRCIFTNWSTLGFYLPFLVISIVLFWSAVQAAACSTCGG